MDVAVPLEVQVKRSPSLPDGTSTNSVVVTPNNGAIFSDNGQIILENYKVKNEKKVISIQLDTSISNEFKILAINEGSILPNTSKIILIDDKRTFELLTSFRKNESAFIT